MRPSHHLLVPVLGGLTLAACASPTYTYGPASYATPPPASPYQPVEIPLPAPPVSAIPLLPPPGRLDLPPDPQPVGPDPLVPDLPPLPDPQAEPPAQVEPAPAAPPPSDPVTDLLLAPPSQQRDAPAAVVKKPSAPEANPMMGFRPMRGQTAPTP